MSPGATDRHHGESPGPGSQARKPRSRVKWTPGAKLLLLPAIVLEIVFLAGLLYVLGGTSHVGREALIPVLGGLVLVLFIFLLPAVQTWRARGVLFAAAAVLAVGSVGLALALPDDRTAAISLIFGAMGIVVLGLAAVVVEIATGRET